MEQSLPPGAGPRLAAVHDLQTPLYPPGSAGYDSSEITPISSFEDAGKEAQSPLHNSYSRREAKVMAQVPWHQRIAYTRHQQFFLIIILLQGLVVLGLQAALFGLLDEDLDLNNIYLRSIAVYLAIFIIAEATEILFAIDALRLRNFLQVSGLLVFTGCLLAYASLMHNQIRDALHDSPPSRCALAGTCKNSQELFDQLRGVIIAIPCVIGAALVSLTLQAYWLLQEFGWDTFKLLGADVRIREYYYWYQVFVVLLKFDAFFLIGFCVQLLILVSSLRTYEIVLTIIALPLVIALLCVAAVSVRTESRIGMGLYGAGVIAGMTYFIYKLVRIFESSPDNPYYSVRRSLGLFGCLCLALLVATSLVSLRVFLNFGKGLARVLPKYSWRRRRSPQEEAAEPNEQRMELD